MRFVSTKMRRKQGQQFLLIRQEYGQTQRVIVWFEEAGLGEGLAVQALVSPSGESISR